MKDEKILYEILESRENRASMQKNIIDKYNKSLISFTLNIPGLKKDSPKYRQIHDLGMETIIHEIEKSGNKIVYLNSFHKKTGPEGYLVVDMNPSDLKKMAINIEEHHKLARVFDIDVFDSNHKQISRTELGFDPRKCLLCDKDAKVCNRETSHSIEDLLEEIDQLYDIYLKN